MMNMHFLDELKKMREQAASKYENDPDRQFLLSLLPLMGQLSPADSTDTKVEIPKAFHRKGFKPAPTYQYGYRTEEHRLHLMYHHYPMSIQ